MRTIKIALVLVAGLVAFAGMAARAADAPSADDTAKFLAGMPVSAGSPLAPMTETSWWEAYSATLDKDFASFEKRQSLKIRDWSAGNLKSPKPNLLYMFSGPDFLYADAFFSKASTYVLSALEPTGTILDLTKIRQGAIPPELSKLRNSMQSLLSISFFITEHMKTDLSGGALNGTLPVIYVLLARTGHTVKDAAQVYLDENGGLQTGDDAEWKKSLAQGVKITASDKEGQDQTIYYFRTNLGNELIKKSGFLQFCEGLGESDAFIKSDSYLLHSGGFSTVRDFLLDHASTIVQDDSGIPISYFDASKWELEPYGNYVEPIAEFPGMYQPKMRQLFVTAKAPKIDFGFGYRISPSQSSILVAVRKLAAAEQ